MRQQRTSAFGHVTSWITALVIIGPVLIQPGFVLVGDMVFVPRQPWKPEWIGADGGVPRAVPGDAVISLLTMVVPGDLLQKAILLAILVGAGWGVVRLCGDARPLFASVASVLYVWNPYVYERLAIGQWALLCGYAALPWVLVAVRSLPARGWPALLPLAGAVAVGAVTSPTGGLLCAILASAGAALGAPWRQAATVLGLSLVLNLPWLLPGVLNGTGVPPDPGGAEVFAARSDTPFGAFWSLFTFGGIWKESIVPAERNSPIVVVAIALSCAGLLGAWLLWRRGARSTRPAVSALALVSLPLLIGTWLISTPAGAPVGEWLVVSAPGGGLARDAQKWIAPFVLLVCWGMAQSLTWLSQRIPKEGVDSLGVALLVAPVALLPTLGLQAWGQWAPRQYPAEWSQAADRLEVAGAADGQTLILPFSAYRRFAWNQDRAVLDPAPRFFPGRVVTDDVLVVDDRAVAGESDAAHRIRRAIASDTLDEELGRMGIRFVLTQRDQYGEVPAVTGSVIHDGKELQVVDRGTGEAPVLTRHAVLFGVIDGLVAMLLLAVAGIAGFGRMKHSGVYARRGTKTWREPE